MMTIFEDCSESIAQAKGLAEFHGEPWVVWRCGDRFAALPESTSPSKVSEAWADENAPIRPVATYDPDGTEHC